MQNNIRVCPSAGSQQVRVSVPRVAVQQPGQGCARPRAPGAPSAYTDVECRMQLQTFPSYDSDTWQRLVSLLTPCDVQLVAKLSGDSQCAVNPFAAYDLCAVPQSLALAHVDVADDVVSFKEWTETDFRTGGEPPLSAATSLHYTACSSNQHSGVIRKLQTEISGK